MEPNGVSAHGVVGVGDSWLTAFGLSLGGVTCTSWAGWLAWATADCLTQHAVNGATAEQVGRDQLPLLRDRQFRIGAAWLGANDIGRLQIGGFTTAMTQVCRELANRCQVVAVATLPASMRTPTLSWRQSVPAVARANEAIRQVTAESGATLVELEDALTGRWAMAPDRQHPTSLGQLEAAHVAAAALDAIVLPRQLPAVTSVAVPLHEQRLYSVPARERVRGALVAMRQRRAEADGVTWS